MKTILSSLAAVNHPLTGAASAAARPVRAAPSPWIRISARAYAFAGWFLSQTDHGVL